MQQTQSPLKEQSKLNRLDCLVVSIKDACEIGNWSRGTLYKKIADGSLEAIKDGDRTKVTTSSIRRHLDELPRYKAEAA